MDACLHVASLQSLSAHAFMMLESFQQLKILVLNTCCCGSSVAARSAWPLGGQPLILGLFTDEERCT